MPIPATNQRLQGRASLLFILSGAFLWSWMDQCMFGPTLFSLVDLDGANYLVIAVLLGSLLGLAVAYLVARQQLQPHAPGSGVSDDPVSPVPAPAAGDATSSAAGPATSSAVSPVHHLAVPLPMAAAFALVGAVGCGLCLAAFNAESGQGALPLAGVVLAGFSMGALIVTWGAPLAALGAGATLLHISGAWAAGLLVNAVFLLTGPLGSWVVAIVLPIAWLAGYALLQKAFANEEVVSPPASESVPISVSANLALLVMVVCGLFGFMTMSYEPPTTAAAITASGMDAVFARCITALAAFAAFSMLPRARYSSVFGVALSFLALGAITLTVSLFVSSLQLPARLLVAIGYAGFDLLVWAVAARSANRNLGDAVRSIAIVIGAQQVGIALGVLGNMAIGVAGMDAEATGIALVVANYLLLVVAYVLVRRYADKIMEAPEKPAPAAAPQAFDQQERVQAFASTYGLTSRETDVLQLLAEGRNVPYIAEKFVVSENTVKSHVRHIYEKCGFHNRQELLDALRDGELE